MRIDELLTDDAALTELGRRLAQHRLERNLTQAELAAQAGVGQATVQRAERGESVQMTSMIRLLRALDLLRGLDAAVPQSIELPIARLEREQGRRRRRASGSRAAGAGGSGGGGSTEGSDQRPGDGRWRWGDEPSGGTASEEAGGDEPAGEPVEDRRGA